MTHGAAPAVRATVGADDPIQAFIALVLQGLGNSSLVKALLAKYRGPQADLKRIDLRPVVLRGQTWLQLVYHHDTRDITHNHSAVEIPALLGRLIGAGAFRHAHVVLADGHYELTITERGQARLLRHAAAPADTATRASPAAARPTGHNRRKQHPVAIDRPFLHELGVTTADHQLVPAMSRKWKQINKFVEIFSHAVAGLALPAGHTLRVADYGCGKGYLTFALHDWLTHGQALAAQVSGVELRPELVKACNAIVQRLGLPGLQFQAGDLASHSAGPLDVIIALHACDTATDQAIHLGLQAGARIILCAPCCHKQIRPQLLKPQPMRSLLSHGVHLEQEAEMVTDSLRALLLEAAGYDTQVFEFISLEHTAKNKMILAVRRALPGPAAGPLQQVAELKGFFGIREHCLEALMLGSGLLVKASSP